ncbi:hypothetical protein Pmar_PMAR002662, partial [Perkinsus marinus ATCC 50983]
MDPEDVEKAYPPKYNDDVPVECRDLINGLLHPDPAQRWNFNCVKKGVMFEGFDWKAAGRKELEVPWLPAKVGEGAGVNATDDTAFCRRRTSITDHYDPLPLRRFSFCYQQVMAGDIDATP